jgi:hypothetical protein
MANATDTWFRKLNEERYDMLTEAKVEDFNLPDIIVGKVRSYLEGTSEKGRIWAAEQWKEQPMPTNDGWKGFVQNSIKELKTLQEFDGDVEAGRGKWKSFKDDIKKVALIIDNVEKALTSQTEGSSGRLKKSLNKAEKALKRNPFIKDSFTSDEEMNERLGDIFGRLKNFAYNTLWTVFYEDSRSIFAYLNDDPSNYEYFKGKDLWDPVEITYYDRVTRKKETADFKDLDTYAQYLLQNIEDEQHVLHTFEDGSYWYDLDTRRCSIEGERMGHCGSADQGYLYSLRYKPKGRKWSSSLVTLEYDPNTETVYQIKGYKNQAPHKGTWEHIAWFIDENDVEYIAETGQHSDDYESFVELREYLDDNTNAQLQDSMEAQADQLQEELTDIETRANNRLDQGYVNAGDVEVEDDHMYYYATAGITYEIPMGWAGFARGPENKAYVATGEGAENFKPMPYRDDFYNWGEMIPNYPEEIEWDLHETPDGVVLKVDPHWSCEDCADGGDFQYFADDFEVSVDNYYEDTVKEITKLLARQGIIKPSGWTTTARELSDLDQQLQNWQTDLDLDDISDTIYFWLVEGENNLDGHIEPGLSIPSEYIMQSGIRPQDTNSIIRQVFGGTHFRGEEVKASALFTDSVANALSETDREANVAAQKQMRLPGIPAEYFRNVVQPIKLSDDMKIYFHGIRDESTTVSQPFAPIELQYRLAIELDEELSKENIQAAMNFMKQMDNDDNVKRVKTAISQVMKIALERAVQQQNKTYQTLEDGTQAKEYIGRIIDLYSGRNDPAAQMRVAFARWAAENLGKMDPTEIFVLTQQYLREVATGQYIDFDPAEDEYPPNWVPRVRTELERRGHPEPRHYKAGMYQESIEEQIARIDRQLSEKTDLRVYRCYVTGVVYHDISTDKQIQDQIRGIPNVTTVDPMSVTKKKLTPTSYRVKFAIKFELLGQQNRETYIKNVLIPHMKKIDALGTVAPHPNVELVSGGKADIRESKIMKEFYGGGSLSGFGGMAGNLGAQRYDRGRTMQTPRPTLQAIIDDWAEGGVQLYDAPSDTTDMRYHVMMPVEELWPLCARHYRGAKIDFDGRYQHFIATGPTAPVYLAIGQNGRAKVTGNEDIVWFAKEAGLEEVPVFLSYQRQA